MKPSRIYYVLMLLSGIVGIIALTAVDYYQIRAATLARNQRWVGRISEMIDAERGSMRPSPSSVASIAIKKMRLQMTI